MRKGLVPLLLALFLMGCHRESRWPYHSFLLGFAIEGYPITQEQLKKTESETGIPSQMIVFYLQWPLPDQTPQSLVPSLDAIASQGAIPCLTWEPMNIVDGIETAVPYQKILDGSYDNYIKTIADELKQWANPCVIRFAHEMNIVRYHWGTDAKNYDSHSPEIYKMMFHHVVNLFKPLEIHNVYWAFCPNADSIPNESWNVPANYYPGDDYVDLLGMDGYNWAITPEIAAQRGQSWTSAWRSFEQTFSALYQELRQTSDKPIIVFETASAEREGMLGKRAWFEEAVKVAKKWGLSGLIWFQAQKEEDWRLSH